METELMQVSDRTKDYLWEEMYDIARHTLYHELLTNQYSNWNRMIRFGLLVGAATTITSSAISVSPLVGYIGAVLLFSLTAIDFIWDLGRRAALSHAASVECSVIEKDYQDLYIHVTTGQISETDCQVRINQLALRTIAATSQIVGTDRKLNKAAQEQAMNILAARWGGTVEQTRQNTTTAEASA